MKDFFSLRKIQRRDLAITSPLPSIISCEQTTADLGRNANPTEAGLQSPAGRVAVAKMLKEGVKVEDWLHYRTAGICPVHDCKRRTAVAPGLEGEIYPDEEDSSAREKHFPHAGIQYSAALISKWRLGKIHLCPQCLQAERNWTAQNE